MRKELRAIRRQGEMPATSIDSACTGTRGLQAFRPAALKQIKSTGGATIMRSHCEKTRTTRKRFLLHIYNAVMQKTMLLVEDEPNDIELALTVLKDHGIANRIVVVRDGEEALDYLLCRAQFQGRDGGNPGLVLLDLKLPKIDGIEVLSTIRATPDLAGIPVVVLTSSSLEADVSRTMALGIDEYIVKPMDVRQFVAQMCAIAERFTRH